jgi:hypothetical protein
MEIILCGQHGCGAPTVALELRDYFAYRGVACYIQDYLEPLHEAVEGVAMAMAHYGIDLFKGGHEKYLLGSLYQLLGSSNGWDKVCQDTYNKHTISWENVTLLYAGVIFNAPSPTLLDKYPGAFKVYLEQSKENRLKNTVPELFRDESHPLEVGFNDCAVSDIFDLVVDTNESSSKDVANLIGNMFLDKIKTSFIKTLQSTKGQSSSNGSP